MPFPDFYLSVAGATILLLAAFIALLHMASRFFNRPQMTAYANVELQQLFISVLIFVAAYGAFEFADMSANFLGFAKGGESTIDVSINFLQKTITEGIMPAYVDLVSLDIKLTFWSSLQGRQGPTVWGFTFKQVPGLEPIISVVRVLTFTLTAFLGTLGTQVVIFYVIRALTPMLLAIGVLVRFFPPTRDAGVFLIVFAIAFHAVFPMLFALNAHILDEMWAAHGWASSYDPYISMGTDLTVPYFEYLIPDKLEGELEALASSPTAVAQIFGFLPFVFFFRFVVLIPFFEGIASLSLPALFLPTLCMSITISFINAVTKFITGKG